MTVKIGVGVPAAVDWTAIDAKVPVHELPRKIRRTIGINGSNRFIPPP
jgi:hypothetical protein